MKKIIYLLALFFCVQIVLAQQDSSYLPLAVGNYWQFKPHYPYTVSYPKYTVTHDTMIAGKQYFLIEEDTVRFYSVTCPWPCFAPIRQDEKGDIYAYSVSQNTECLLYRFSEHGYYSSCYGNIKNMGYNDSVTTIVIGGEVEANFQQGIGPISFGIHEYSYILSRAVINNICVTCSPIAAVEKENSIPKNIKLYQNYPNPFNPETKISFDIPETGIVKLKVFSITGQEINTLINETKSAGSYTVMWDGRDKNNLKISSGVYFYQLIFFNNNNQITSIKKMIFTK
jgi:hypothetical protein